MKSIKLLIMVLSLSVGFIACGDEHDDHDGHDHSGHGHGSHSAEEMDKEACIHFQKGPAEPVTAGAKPEEATAPKTFTHSRVDVTFVDLEDSKKGGFVSFSASKDGSVSFYLGDKALNFQVWETATELKMIDKRQVSDVSDCTEAAVKYTYELKKGAHILQFGPGDLEKVSLVAE